MARKKNEETNIDYIDVYDTLDEDLDSLEKSSTLLGASLSKNEERTSTGLLALDVVLGGGIVGGGWYTIFGAEQSAKSTICMTIMVNLLKTDIPVCSLVDYEGCVTGETQILIRKKNSPPKVIQIRDIPKHVVFKTNNVIDTCIEVFTPEGFVRATHFITKDFKNITTIELENGYALNGYKHPVLVVEDGSFQWVLIEDIKLGDVVVCVSSWDSVTDNSKKSIELLFSTVIKAEISDTVSRVYDLTMSTPDNIELKHSFLANGIVTHNSTQPDYVENIMKTSKIKGDITTLFGQRDMVTGEQIVKPRVRNYQPDTGEDFFDYVAKLERLLPDKILIGNKWYYIYPNTRNNQKKLAGLYDKTYFKEKNKFKVPAKDGTMQAIILLDSYPSMLPRSLDVDDPSAALAMQARMFSDGIKRIKGSMRKKRISILGVNQLRLRPMVAYGCFHYNTRIKTASGQTLMIGDIVENKLNVDVIAYDKKEGKFVTSKVVNHFDNGQANKDSFIEIYLEDQEEPVIVTPGHKLLRYGSRQEEHAVDFKVGDMLTGYNFSENSGNSATPKRIVDIQKHSLIEESKLYDLEVEGQHNYIAENIVVHNSPEYEPCFLGNTKVLLPEGKYETIENIVRNKKKLNVISMNNNTQELEVKQIVDWKDNGFVLTEDIVTVSYQTGTSIRNIHCTKSHKFHTNYGKIKAENLQNGDVLYIPDTETNNVKLSFVRNVTPYKSNEKQLRVYDLTILDNHNYFVFYDSADILDAVCVSNCGEALKFYSDVRIRARDMAIPATFKSAGSKTSGKILEEDSVTDEGLDAYRFIKIFGFKNKLSMPYIEGILRLWISDANGEARGFDPVYDTYWYLVNTGQIGGTRNNLKFIGTPFDGIGKVKWITFKMLVVGNKEDIIDWCRQYKIKPTSIRKFCFEQLKSGEGLRLFQKYQADSKRKKATKDSDI